MGGKLKGIWFVQRLCLCKFGKRRVFQEKLRASQRILRNCIRKRFDLCGGSVQFRTGEQTFGTVRSGTGAFYEVGDNFKARGSGPLSAGHIERIRRWRGPSHRVVPATVGCDTLGSWNITRNRTAVWERRRQTASVSVSLRCEYCLINFLGVQTKSAY